MVNGPLFSIWTVISAPKIPVSVWNPAARHCWMMYSYNLFARSGDAARIKDGRFPFLRSEERRVGKECRL